MSLWQRYFISSAVKEMLPEMIILDTNDWNWFTYNVVHEPAFMQIA